MKKVDTYFVVAEEGKTLVREGKEIGKAVWLAAGLSADNIENKGIVEVRTMLFPAEGKILKNKKTEEYSQGCWLKDTKEKDWEETDIPEIKEPEDHRLKEENEK